MREKMQMDDMSKKAFLFLSLANSLSFYEATATDFKKYIPKEFRHYVPDFVGEDFNSDEDFDISPEAPVGKGDISSYGPRHYTSQTFENLKVYGPTHLEKIRVEGETLIYGPLIGKKLITKNLNVQGPVILTELKSDSIEINGPVNLSKSVIKGELVINGPLTAYHADLGKISIATNTMKLVDTTAESVVVRKNSEESSKPQKIFLSGKTVIKKGIIFEKGEGLVVADKGVIIEGDVKGGKIVQRLSPN